MTLSQAFLQIYTFKVLSSSLLPDRKSAPQQRKAAADPYSGIGQSSQGAGGGGGGGRQFTTTEVEKWNKNIFPIFSMEKESVWRAFCAYGEYVEGVASAQS